jgi:UDP-2,3-diacylglucosamine hydrolase
MAPAPLLFIADLHLSRERPRPVELFRRFLAEIAPTSGALYILGDFFEAWIGDDDLEDDLHAGLAADLRALALGGVPVFFLPGNRDFLAGEVFAQAAGLILLADPTTIDLFGTPTLLTHGDAYCTDDINYQAFRRQVRDPAWQAAFLARPLAERHALARELRERSELAKAGKKPEIMDVNIDAVSLAFRERGVSRIIHGHTHRPARHQYLIDGRPCERWVLADWYEESGGYLRCDTDGCRALPYPPT